MNDVNVGLTASVVLAGSLVAAIAQQSAPELKASAPLVATGKVVGPNEQPVAGLPVQVQGPQGKTVVFTDAKGKWSLYNLPAGTYHVSPFAAAASVGQPVEFSVKEKGLVDKLFGGYSAAYIASDIKLNGEFKQ
jgi:hypothetical protein